MISTLTTAHRRRALLRMVGVFVMIVLTAVGLLGMPGGAATGAKSAPRLKDPAATGRELSTEYMTLLQAGNLTALAKFLDPAFQLQRADGSGADRSEFLANPAKVTTFALDDTLEARQHDDVLTVRWAVATDQIINGVAFRTGSAPRISAYRWSGKRWRLVSHANFNLPA